MIEKGIMLAGGKGTRLSPVTKSTNKQLLPIYDKPLFFYPLSILMLADIKKILIIVNKGQKKNFYNLIGNGKHLGINITYKEQIRPSGIPESFKIGKKFIGKSKVALILGDNFFYGQGLIDQIKKAKTFEGGCTVYLKNVSKPENYGVVKIKKNKIDLIVEKPKKFISSKVITGLYFFDNEVVKLSKKLKPSKRNETEIVDLIKYYKKKDLLNHIKLGRGAIWSDAGKIDDLINISNFVTSVEKVQGLKIACLDEIAFKKKWIKKEQLIKNINFYGNCPYSDYLKKILKS
tara:strand:+ start:32 stop:901 length:870 start_codon:yes stop_codon:yes gene_type:complete